MKLMIDIPDKDYEKLKDGHIPFSILDVMQNGIPIPENSTNGDMVKMIFPDSKIMDLGNKKRIWLPNQYLINCSLDWWNSPYKRGETEC